MIRRLDGLLQGSYRTAFRGIGTDFLDLREYEPGDDVRHIDWNVTARMDTPFVRQYTEDRELTAWLLLDRSPSMGFGPIDRPKELVLSELATALARLLTRGGNRVGRDPLRQRDRGDAPAAQQPEPGARPRPEPDAASHGRTAAVTDLTGLLESAHGAIRRRSLVVAHLRLHHRARAGSVPLLRLTERHEVVAIRLLDPREYELPDAGVIVVEDAETGEQLVVDSSDAEFRRRLREAGEHREAELRALTAPRRRRHLRGVDRGRPRPGARPDRRVAQVAAPLMSLGSPWMLLCLACRPRPGARVRVGAPAARRAGRPARVRRARADDAGAACPLAAPHPLRALRGGARARLLRARAPDREPRRCRSGEGTVILAFDVSNSMRAKDLEPTRIDAAKAAATAFVERQPSSIRIGVVAFGDGAVTVLQPTNVKADVIAAIKRLSVERRNVARPGPLHVAQRDRREAADDRRSRRSRATPAT